jgi:O-antigen ligase
MNKRLQVRMLLCLTGLLASLVLASNVLFLRQSIFQATTISYTALPSTAEWEGNWEFSTLGADPSEAGSQTGADRVTIPFTGTDLALQVRRGAYRGYFYVTVDGEPANRLPQDERGAYLVLTSPDYAPQVVTIPVAGGLEDGPHMAVIVAERGWDQWPLVGWNVSHVPDDSLYRWLLVASVALGLACLGGLLWGARGIGRQGDKGTGRGGAESPISNLQLPTSNIYLPLVLIAAAVFYFSPWLPLTVVGALGLAALVVLRLDLGLALVAATVPFYLHPRVLLGKSFSMAEIVVLLCVLSWGTRLLMRGRFAIRHCRLQSAIQNLKSEIAPIDLAVLFFVTVAVASTCIAEFRHVALRELRVAILEPALFYLMLRTSRLGEKTIWRLVDFFVLGAVAVALIGLVQYALGVNVITAEEGFRRLRSVYGSPNNAALYLGRALPLLVAVALFGKARIRRIAYGLAAALVGLAVLLTFSKGALILGVPLSLLALGLLAGGRWRWAALGMAALVVVAVTLLLQTPRFAPLLNTAGGTTFFRLSLWRSAWTMFREHPWLGVGPDNFLYQYRSRYILPAAWQEPDLSHAHDILLDYATRLGIAGLAAGVWLQIAFWRRALPLRCLADADRRALALGLMGAMVNFLAHGLVDASYFVIDLAFVFFMTLGLVQRLARSESDESETQLS